MPNTPLLSEQYALYIVAYKSSKCSGHASPLGPSQHSTHVIFLMISYIQGQRERKKVNGHQAVAVISNGHQAVAVISNGHQAVAVISNGHQAVAMICNGHQAVAVISNGHRAVAVISNGHQAVAVITPRADVMYGRLSQYSI